LADLEAIGLGIDDLGLGDGAKGQGETGGDKHDTHEHLPI
jgi:hypothetical protein